MADNDKTNYEYTSEDEFADRAMEEVDETNLDGQQQGAERASGGIEATPDMAWLSNVHMGVSSVEGAMDRNTTIPTDNVVDEFEPNEREKDQPRREEEEDENSLIDNDILVDEPVRSNAPTAPEELVDGSIEEEEIIEGDDEPEEETNSSFITDDIPLGGDISENVAPVVDAIPTPQETEGLVDELVVNTPILDDDEIFEEAPEPEPEPEVTIVSETTETQVLSVVTNTIVEQDVSRGDETLVSSTPVVESSTVTNTVTGDKTTTETTTTTNNYETEITITTTSTVETTTESRSVTTITYSDGSTQTIYGDPETTVTISEPTERIDTTTETRSDEVVTTNEVVDPNYAPEATPVDIEGTEEVVFTFTADDLIAASSDQDGDNLTVVGVNAGDDAPGTLVDNGDGTYTFTPDENYNGEFQFEYTVSDGYKESTSTINVAMENTLDETNRETTNTVDTDVSVGEETLANSVTTTTVTTVIDPETGDETTTTTTTTDNTYETITTTTTTTTPVTTITYDDGSQSVIVGEPVVTTDTSVSTRTDQVVEVNDVIDPNEAPEASDKSFTIDEDGSLTITDEQLLENATDADGDDLSITGVSYGGDDGTLVDNGDGTYTFTPNADWNGDLELSYTVSDGYKEDTADIAIEVTPVRDVVSTETTTNVISVNTETSTENDVSRGEETLVSSSSEDSTSEVVDEETGDKTTTTTTTTTNNYQTEVTTTTTTTETTTTVTQEVTTITYDDGTTETIAAEPVSNTVVGEPVVETSTDYETRSEEVVTTDDEVDPNYAPDAEADSFTMTEDTSILITSDDLIANDIDNDGDNLTVTDLQYNGDDGTLVDNGDGTWAFTPNANWHGELSMTYTVSDGYKTDVADVSFVVENDMTDLVSSNTETVTNTTVENNEVLVDTDTDTSSNTVTNQETGDKTTTTTTTTTDTYENTETTTTTSQNVTTNTYEDGSEQVSYGEIVTDVETDVTTRQEVDVDTDVVVDPNYAPDAEDKTFDFVEDNSFTFSATDLLENATDADNDTLTVTSVSGENLPGTLVDNGNETWTFTPNADWNGNFDLTFTISDGFKTDTATITMEVENDNSDVVTVETVNEVVTDTQVGDEYSTGSVLDSTTTNVVTNEDTGDKTTTTSETYTDSYATDTTVTTTTTPVTTTTYEDGSTTVVRGDSTVTSNTTTETRTEERVETTSTFDENFAPDAVDQTFTMTEDDTIIITSEQLLNGATDIDNDDLSVTSVSYTGSNGTLTDNNDGTWTFEPNDDWNGDIDLSYTISDGYKTDDAHIDLTVENDNTDAVSVTVENEVVTDISRGDETLTDTTLDSTTANTVTEDDGDKVTTTNNVYTDTYTTDVTTTTSTTPVTTTTYEDGSTIVVRGDTTSTTDVTQETREVERTETLVETDENFAPDAVDHDFENVELNDDGQLVITSEQLLANATDADGDDLSVTSVTYTDTNGTLVDNSDGTWTFTPNEDWDGEFSIDYTVSDGYKEDTATAEFEVEETDTHNQNNGWGNGDQDAPGNSGDNNNAENNGGGDEAPGNSGNNGNGNGGGSNQNNGWGNGDQDAPGNSGSKNNAENNQDAEDTTGDDIITGSNRSDYLEGGEGNDELSGGKGDDYLYGDEGDDTLDGGAKNDVLVGGEGNDTLIGGDGNDTLYGEAGNDVFHAGAGDDTIYGGQGDDTLMFEMDGEGTTGDNWVGLGDGNDTITLAGENGWTLTVEGEGEVDHHAQVNDYIESAEGMTGQIDFDDGSTIIFEGVEKIEW